MPNRILKETICTSPTIDGLSAAEENFFYRLLVNCDDYGRFDARPSILAASLYPLRRVGGGKVEKMLDQLVSKGLVYLYEVGGRPYLEVTTWGQHQRIRNSRLKYPAPSGGNSPQVAANGGRSRPESESESESKKYRSAISAEQTYLLEKLHSDQRWARSLTFGAVQKLRGMYGAEAVTSALRMATEETLGEIERPYAWVAKKAETLARAS